MNGVDQLEAMIGEVLRVRQPRAVVADRDDRVPQLFRPQLEELIDAAKHRQPADSRTGQRRVGIDEADRVELAAGAQDVEHDLPMPTGADDEDV